MAETYTRTFHLLARIAAAVTLCVIVLGAFVRLSDAGLGCPDWPGCYGHLLGVPESPEEIAAANRRYSENLVQPEKAWKEVAHRYLAGLLGLLILGLAITAMLNRRASRQPVALPIALLALTVFQALLGMWTVTLFLQPIIVVLHLLGGMTILALLWWLVLETSSIGKSDRPDRGLPAYQLTVAILAAALLILQIALGGWTSANYAALACPDFPTCQQQWWPDAMDFQAAFTLWHNTGINYALNPMDSPARIAIHLLHRIGAIIILIAVGIFSLGLCKKSIPKPIRTTAMIGLFLLGAQFILGISNVLFHLPIAVATAHNGVAALLLSYMVTMIYMLKLAQHKQRN